MDRKRERCPVRTCHKLNRSVTVILNEIADIKSDMPTETLEDFNAYLEPFTLPEKSKNPNFATGENRCSCGEMLDGLMGAFQWGIRHGDGFCSACGQPVRMYHTIKDRHGKVLAELRNVMLLYTEWEPTDTTTEEDIEGTLG